MFRFSKVEIILKSRIISTFAAMEKNEQNKVKKGFEDFTKVFPEVELPVSLTEDTRHLFSMQNKPISDEMLATFIIPFEEEEAMDEFTEFMACFKLPGTGAFHALVFWRADLLNYQYKIITFDKNGAFINKRVIAGIYSDGEVVTQSVATIEPNMRILIASGQSLSSEHVFDAASSTTYQLELKIDGTIGNV